MTATSGLMRVTCNLCGTQTILDEREQFFGCPVEWSHLNDTVEEKGGKLQYAKHVCGRCLETLNKNVRQEQKGGE